MRFSFKDHLTAITRQASGPVASKVQNKLCGWGDVIRSAAFPHRVDPNSVVEFGAVDGDGEDEGDVSTPAFDYSGQLVLPFRSFHHGEDSGDASIPAYDSQQLVLPFRPVQGSNPRPPADLDSDNEVEALGPQQFTLAFRPIQQSNPRESTDSAPKPASNPASGYTMEGLRFPIRQKRD